jgi:DNA-binding response OmpR family regulator
LNWKVCEELRKDYPEGLPVIMLSANGDEASVLRGLQVNFSCFATMIGSAYSHNREILYCNRVESRIFNIHNQILAQAGSNDYVKKPFSRAEVFNF